MHRKLLLLLLLLPLLATRPEAHAQVAVGVSAAATSLTAEDNITKAYLRAELAYAHPLSCNPADKVNADALAALEAGFSLPHHGEQAHTSWNAIAALRISAGRLAAEPFAAAGIIFKDHHTHLAYAGGVRISFQISRHLHLTADCRSTREYSCVTNHSRVGDPPRFSAGIGLRCCL